VPGDRVTLHRNEVVVRASPDTLYRWSVPPLFPDDGEFSVRSFTVPKGYIYVLATSPGFLDSRHWSSVHTTAVEGRAVFRAYPFSEFGPLVSGSAATQ
jgi:hypothetical protein